MTTTPPPLAFVDTETTDIGHRRLAWELAIIRREPDGTRKELQTFVEVDLTSASPFALQVGRFYERHPLGRSLCSITPINDWKSYGDGSPIPSGFPDGSTMSGYVEAPHAAALWCRWTHGAHIIGAVPNFDTEVMGKAARDAELLPGHHYHLADVENLIVGWMRGRLSFDASLDPGERVRLERLSVPPWKSDELLAEVGVSVPDYERHTALGDARAVERVWDVLYGGTA